MDEPTPAAAAKAPAAPKAGISIVGIVLPALLAAGASFGGTRLAASHPAPAHSVHVVEDPPGATVSLEPFIISIVDEAHKMHAMKIAIAVEFKKGAKEEELKAFGPRLRDSTLAFLRAMTFEESADAARMDKARTELLERYRHAGLVLADKVLVTDFVLQ